MLPKKKTFRRHVTAEEKAAYAPFKDPAKPVQRAVPKRSIPQDEWDSYEFKIDKEPLPVVISAPDPDTAVRWLTTAYPGCRILHSDIEPQDFRNGLSRFP